MIYTFSTGPDGDIYVNEGHVGEEGTEGNLVLKVSARVFTELNLFDEDRLTFSWDGDAERATEIVSWMLEDVGLAPHSDEPYGDDGTYPVSQAVRMICEPGGPFNGWPMVHLEEQGLSEVELHNAQNLFDGTVMATTGKPISMQILYSMGLVTAYEVRSIAMTRKGR